MGASTITGVITSLRFKDGDYPILAHRDSKELLGIILLEGTVATLAPYSREEDDKFLKIKHLRNLTGLPEWEESAYVGEVLIFKFEGNQYAASRCCMEYHLILDEVDPITICSRCGELFYTDNPEAIICPDCYCRIRP